MLGMFTWFLFMIPPLIFMIYAQAKVNSAFKKYSKVANTHRVSGARAAETLLRDNGLDNVELRGYKGSLATTTIPGTRFCAFRPRFIAMTL